MAASTPLVSVLMSAYNHADYVAETLDSILAQDYPNIEIVIFNDGSKDNTDEVLTQYVADHPEANIRYTSDKNEGFCRKLNRGLEMAEGKYVAPMGTDDLWLPDHISRHVALLESEPLVAMSFSDAYFMFGDVKTTRRYCANYRPFTQRFFAKPRTVQEVHHAMLRQNLVLSPTVVIRRDALVSLGGWDESLKIEDMDMWLRITRNYPIRYIDAADAYYRQHENNVSRNTMRTVKATLQLLGKAYSQPPLAGRPLAIASAFVGYWGHTVVNRINRMKNFSSAELK